MLIADALEIIKGRLEQIDGLTVTTTPGQTVVPPMAEVLDGEMEYHSTFGRGYDAQAFTITLFVSEADNAAGVLEAREFKSGHGPKSIRAALESGSTPGFEGEVVESAVTGFAERDGRYITVVFRATAQLSGKAS